MQVSPILSRASVLIAAGSRQWGSGYYLGSGLVATCFHVADKIDREDPIDVWFEAAGQQRRAKLLRWSVDCDAALLELERDADGIEPLKLDGEATHADDWEAYAFPGFTAERSIVLRGGVENVNGAPHGKRAIQLYCPRLHDQPKEGVGGISGAAVMSNGRVIGHFLRVLGAEGEGKQAKLGFLYAVPADVVMRLLAAKHDGTVEGMCKTLPARQLAGAEPILVELYSQIEHGIFTPEALRLKLFGARADGVNVAGAVLLAAEKYLARGKPTDALDILELLTDARERAEQLRAFAWSLRGEHEKAAKLLHGLRMNSETGGILGGVLKRRWRATGENAYLQMAYEVYESTFEANRQREEDAFYPGINAASLALCLDRADKSKDLAREVEGALGAVPADRWKHWHWASLAEACLLLGRDDEARSHYAHASELAKTPRDAAAMRLQVRLVLQRQGRPSHLFDDAFPPLGVAYLAQPLGTLGPDDHDAVVADMTRLAYERRIRVAYCSGLNPTSTAFARAMHAVSAIVSAYVPDPDHTAPAPATVVHLQDRPAPDAAIAATACEEAALQAAREMGRLLDEEPAVIRVTKAEGGARPTVLVEKVTG